jgi:hypothetical protein
MFPMFEVMIRGEDLALELHWTSSGICKVGSQAGSVGVICSGLLALAEGSMAQAAQHIHMPNRHSVGPGED